MRPRPSGSVLSCSSARSATAAAMFKRAAASAPAPSPAGVTGTAFRAMFSAMCSSSLRSTCRRGADQAKLSDFEQEQQAVLRGGRSGGRECSDPAPDPPPAPPSYLCPHGGTLEGINWGCGGRGEVGAQRRPLRLPVTVLAHERDIRPIRAAARGLPATGFVAAAAPPLPELAHGAKLQLQPTHK